MNKGVITGLPLFKRGKVRDIYDLGDRLLTPDSSRFWPMEDYQPGVVPQSFDKQYVRDYLLSLQWTPGSPAPILPLEIVQKTQDKYAEALLRLTPSPGSCFGH